MALTRRDTYLRSKYNLTEEQYLAILAHQDGRCAVCRELPAEGTWLPVDHDHVTGVNRGLLCHYCNLRVVGRHRTGERLRAAADYLDAPPALVAIGEVRAPTATDRRKAKAKRASAARKRAKARTDKGTYRVK